MRWLPGLQTIRHYEAAWLRHDLTAGLALTSLLVPVGIAYAVAAGLPAINGLYATIFGLLAYALFGPSRVLVLGPDSSLVALILGVVVPLSAGNPERAASLAAMLAVVSGGFCILAGVARLGFLTELLSKPIRYGYINGIALTVLVAQLPALFGFSVKGEGFLATCRIFAESVASGKTNWVSLAIGAGTLALLWLLRRWKRVPAALIVVVAATAIVAILGLAQGAGVVVLGTVPQGLPAFALPSITANDIVPVLVGGLAIALVSFADTSVLSRTVAARVGAPVDTNAEMTGLGAANVAAGLFQGFPISASASRTPVAMAAGAKTQMTGVVGALVVALLVMLAPNLLADMPRSALAAVVIVAAIELIESDDLARIYRIQRWEFWLAMVCLVAVIVLGAIEGIGLAIAIAVVEFVWNAWRPYSAVLGRVDNLKGYHDISRHPEARLIPGLVMLRWDAPLFFANAEYFRDRVLGAVAASTTPVRRVVVNSEPITNIDITAADILVELDQALHKAGIELCFAELRGPVKDKLRQLGLLAQLSEERSFRTLGQAVSDYLEDYKVDWVDWEDR
jgi:high affinity sulfate transporter 1